MKELKINTTIGGSTYSIEQLDFIQYQREKHVLQEMIHLGAEVKDGDKNLTYDDINYLSTEDTRRLIVKTKAELGEQGTLNLYKDSIKKCNKLWKDIIRDYKDEDGYKSAHAYMNIEGITIQELQESIRSAVNGEGTDALSTNPDHFTDIKTEGLARNEKCGVEVMGMYGGPLPVIVVFDPSMTGPAVVESGWKIMIAGTSKLMDGTPRHDIAVHQVRPKENGFDLKMEVHFPKNTPIEMVKGHQVHLAIEFLEGVRNAFNRIQK